MSFGDPTFPRTPDSLGVEQRRDRLAQDYEYLPPIGSIQAGLDPGVQEPHDEYEDLETFVGAETVTHEAFLENAVVWDQVVFQESELALNDPEFEGRGDAIAYLESDVALAANQYLELLVEYGVTLLADVKPITYLHNEAGLAELARTRSDSIWGTSPQFVIPPRSWWPNIVAPLLALQKILERDSYVTACFSAGVTPRSTIVLYNGYRPTPYNDVVGGTSGSRHRFNHAIDVKLRSEDRAALGTAFFQAVNDFFDEDPMVQTHFIGINNYASGSRHIDGRLPDDLILRGYPSQRDTHRRRRPWQGAG